MTNRKSIRKALITGALAIVVCLSMLAGTTWAWFTDSTSTAVNTIHSGTLKVAIVDAEGLAFNGNVLRFRNADGASGDAFYWEPGATYISDGFCIKNAGNLALKYQLLITAVNGNAKLLDVISFSVIDDSGMDVDLSSFEGKLEEADEMSEVLYLKAAMSRDAGNEYQGLTLAGIGLSVSAAQLSYESDSYDNTYDQYAPYTTEPTVDFSSDAQVYTLQNAADLLALAKEVNENGNSFNGKTIKLGGNVDLAYIDWTPIGQTGATQFQGTFDGCGYTISHLNVNSSANTSEYYSSGLFGWLNSATIKNVTIDGAKVVGHHFVGALAGYVESNVSSVISNCHVKNATIQCTHANDLACGNQAGALIGYAGNANTTLDNCSAANCTVSASYDAGQLVGAASVGAVTNCTATNVTVSEDTSAVCDHAKAGTNIREELIGRVMS